MKKALMLALVAGIFVPVGNAAFAKSGKPSEPSSSPKGTINISCYRGPLKTVAWDRPNAVFIEDLVKSGYSYEEAEAIGSRVCRDEWGVGDGAHKINSLKRIMRENPPRKR